MGTKTMAEESSATEFKPFGVVIKNHYEPIYSLHLSIESSDLTIGKLKTLIEEQHKGNPLVQDQLLVYRGKLLESQTILFSLCEPNNDTTKSSLPSLYIHMTLRGGSATAAKIGLSAQTSIDSSKTNSSSSSSTSSSSEQKEEKKSSDPPRISPIPIRRQSNPYIAHYYNMQRSYPPNPYNLNSPTLPNMMHPNMMHPHPQTLHRHHSAPPTSAHVSQSFAPPTLVQQTSNPNNSHIQCHIIHTMRIHIFR